MLSQLCINIAVSAAHVALVAVGFSVIYQSAKCFHFAHAAVYTVGAYAVYSFASLEPIPLWLAIVVGTVAGATLGGIIELAVYRPLRQTGATSLILMLASLGMLIVVQNTISIIYGDGTRSLSPTAGFGASFRVLGGRVTTIQLILILLSIISIAALAVVRTKTRLGLAMRAVSNDIDLGRLIGVSVEKTIFASVLCGSALAGLAGVLWGYNSAINPQMGFAALLSGVVAALIGGTGSLRGVLLGSILLTIVQQVVIWHLPGHWQDVPVFVVLIIILLLKPYNVLGKRLRRVSV